MKRWKKIVLIVLAVLVVVLGALVFWQWKNLKAVHAALTTDREALAQSVQDTADEHREELENGGITVNRPSSQQTEDLLDGKVTAEEVKTALGILTLPSSDEEPGQPGETSGNGSATDKPTAETLLNQCVAELYSCQIDLMAKLGEMKQAALEEWKALPAAERTTLKKQEIGMAGLRQCYNLESETDSDVKEILARYRTQLEEIGADTSTLDKLWTYYCEEKEAQKAFYLNKYLN